MVAVRKNVAKNNPALNKSTPPDAICAKRVYTGAWPIEIRGTDSRSGLATVDSDLLAVGHHDPFQPDDLLAVGELIANARDRVAGLDRRLCPSDGFHPVDRGST